MVRARVADVPVLFAASKRDHGPQEEERPWIARYNYLKSKGYKLDDRYAPDWEPSWATEDVDAYVNFRYLGASERQWYLEHEDAFVDVEARDTVKDAVRLSDGLQVIIKFAEAGSPELEILRYLSAEDVASDPRNPAQRLVDAFSVAEDDPLYGPCAMFIVLPLARDWRLPPFVVASEVIAFMRQLLEGLCFLHEHNIAHRDIRADNIMMDPTTLFPHGMHPKNNIVLASEWLFPEPQQACDRADADMRYFLIDYGSSIQFPSCDARENVPAVGCELYAPEMAKADSSGVDSTRYCDPFKGDVFALGMFTRKYFRKVLPELEVLWAGMLEKDPARRFSADDSLRLFTGVTSQFSRRVHLRRVPNVRLADFGEHWTRYSVVKERLKHWVKYFKVLLRRVVGHAWQPGRRDT
ncbi:kinase-like protein [Exidia glandulosa HHB12029]|uniref:Kinase-like protein n=1 Tax=Exidia glandulosa HHB12029 TaxID=1314781 RepID=A0A166B299_EXIGL|nr:kinase-like protein [Exidia glandulosa HHB12029]